MRIAGPVDREARLIRRLLSVFMTVRKPFARLAPDDRALVDLAVSKPNFTDGRTVLPHGLAWAQRFRVRGCRAQSERRRWRLPS